MFLKEMKGEDQIDWFRRTFSDGDNKKEKVLKQNIKVAKEAYRNANREYTRLDKALQIHPLYENAEANYKRFATPISAEEVKERLSQARDKWDGLKVKERQLETVTQNIRSTELNIQHLEEQLANQKKNLVLFQDSKTEIQEYIAENATAKMDYDEVEAEYMKVSETLAEEREWSRVLEMKKDMDQFAEARTRAEQIKDKNLDDLQKLTKKFMPDIKGFELRIPKGMDDDSPEGLFYNGKTLAQLSESELWGLFFEIWEQKQVRFVFVENVSSLGTNAIETLNFLATQGVKVFANSMDRKKDVMKITITDKID
jgi:hypothetical protein